MASEFNDIPGEPTKISTKVLSGGAAVMQKFDPVRSIGQHLCALHTYNHDLTRQVRAHHYCSCLNEDVHQCVIYDSDKPNARLIGVEFIVTERVFHTLSDDEKKLWHSHEYEVKSGLLFMPGLPIVAEKEVMKKLVKSYGKTWHFWQVDRGDPLPLGIPQLMSSFTEDSGIKRQLLEGLESDYNFDMKVQKENRKDLQGPEGGVHPLADHQQTGYGFRTELKEVPLG